MTTPKIPAGQPTWCRRRAAGGCSLPTSKRRGANEPDRITAAVDIRLDHMGSRVVHTSTGRRVVDVWMVPAEAWAEGDVIELGPIPPNVVVDYDIPRCFVAPLAALRAREQEGLTA